jgi:hypothetical protein
MPPESAPLTDPGEPTATAAGQSITCPDCGRTSHHPEDIKQGYCGFCHWWTSDPALAHLNPKKKT